MKVGGLRGAAGDCPGQLCVTVRGKGLYLLLRKAEITSGGGEKTVKPGHHKISLLGLYIIEVSRKRHT